MFIINKMDCFILELKLLFKDVYFKFKYVVEEVNIVIINISLLIVVVKCISFEKGNVLFVCIDMGWCFIFQLFVKMYMDMYGDISFEDFVCCFWGDVYFNFKKCNFICKLVEECLVWSFVYFVLEFIYKIFIYFISDSLE